MSKRRCTAFDTLLTFWPPAPCARTAVSSTSDSGIGTTDKLSPGCWNRFSARVLEDRPRAASRGIARILDRVARPIAVDARPLGGEVARARRARPARGARLVLFLLRGGARGRLLLLALLGLLLVLVDFGGTRGARAGLRFARARARAGRGAAARGRRAARRALVGARAARR